MRFPDCHESCVLSAGNVQCNIDSCRDMDFWESLPQLLVKREYLASIMRKASESVARLEGCLLHVVFEDLNDKDSLWVTEIWTSKNAHDMSLQDDSVKSTIAEAMPYIDTSKLSRVELLPLFGIGLPSFDGSWPL